MNTAHHDKLKTKLAFGYSGKDIPTIESDVDEQLGILVSLIKRKYISTPDKYRPLDMGSVAIFFAVDTLHMSSLANVFGPEAKDQKDMLASTSLIVNDDEGVRTNLSNCQGFFIRHGISKAHRKAEIIFQILASSDTTAHAVRTTILNIMIRSRVYRRLQAEVDAAIVDGRIKCNPVSTEEVVLREGLQFSPPTTALVAKQVPLEGDTFGGRFLPGGTRVSVINILSIQKSKDFFGEDADVFRPERWLDISDEKYREMSQVVDQVFGWGRWQCLGKQIALLELNKVIVELLRHFNFEVVNPERPWERLDVTLWVVSDCWVRVTERVVW
ncbi:cytochrome P450 [Ustulina deusta]|nr:cytochrome P450 [Ustulina deusta]